jgi:hypothetical protein
LLHNDGGDSALEIEGVGGGDARTCDTGLPHDELEAMSGYHRRSLIETKMHRFELLGERVASRTSDRRIAGLKVRAAVLNRFSQLGPPNTVRVAWKSTA